MQTKKQFQNQNKKQRSKKNKQRQKYTTSTSGYQLAANYTQPKKVIFKYCAAITRTNTTVATPYQFGSSLYDPDYSGTGGQPYNYDQMTTLYGYYRIDRMVVYVEVMNTSSSPIIAAVFPTTSSTLNTAVVTQFMQYPEAQWATIGAVTGGQNIHKFKKVLVPHQMLNLPVQDDSLKSYFAASPTASVFLNITHQHSDLSSSASAVYSVQIDFYATMMNLQNPGDSVTVNTQNQQNDQQTKAVTKQAVRPQSAKKKKVVVQEEEDEYTS